MKSDDLSFKQLVIDRINSDWGGKVSAAEKAFGLKGDTIRNVIRSESSSGPGLETARRIAEVLNLEFYIGPQRSRMIAESSLATNEEFARVDRYLVDLSAGPGTNGHNVEKTAPVAFRADWMRQRGLEVTQCVVLNVRGDSMSPTLDDGDMVLVDQVKRPIRNMQIYAFADTDGHAKVKRFELGNDQLIIRSDNVAHQTIVLSKADANSLNVIGKVVWSGRELPR